MDNKNFNADQSIELIQRMIRDTRRNLSSGSSNLFIYGDTCSPQPPSGFSSC